MDQVLHELKQMVLGIRAELSIVGNDPMMAYRIRPRGFINIGSQNQIDRVDAIWKITEHMLTTINKNLLTSKTEW